MNNLEGFRQMTEVEIGIRGPMNKKRIAEMCIPKDVTFDYTLPQQWLDFFMDKVNRMTTESGKRYTYSFVLATTFMLYSDERGFRQGIPWSACAELDRKIWLLSNREKGPMPECLTAHEALEIVLEMAGERLDEMEDDMSIEKREMRRLAIGMTRTFYLGK